MTSANNAEAFDEVEDLVDLRSIWFGLRRRAALFLGVTASIFALIAGYALLSTELYTAETSIMIEPNTQVFAYGSELMGQAAVDPTMVDTEVELLRSRAMTMRVYDRLRTGNLSPAMNPNDQNAEEGDDFFGQRLSDIAADLADLQSNKSVITGTPEDDDAPAQDDRAPAPATRKH